MPVLPHDDSLRRIPLPELHLRTPGDRARIGSIAGACGVGEEFQEFINRYVKNNDQVLAQAHARSDEDTGVMKGNAEETILKSVNRNVFRNDVVRHAKTASNRTTPCSRKIRPSESSRPCRAADAESNVTSASSPLLRNSLIPNSPYNPPCD